MSDVVTLNELPPFLDYQDELVRNDVRLEEMTELTTDLGTMMEVFVLVGHGAGLRRAFLTDGDRWWFVAGADVGSADDERISLDVRRVVLGVAIRRLAGLMMGET